MFMNSIETTKILENSQPVPSSTRRYGRWLLPLVIAGVIAVLVFGIRSRVKAASNLRTVTAQMAVPSVAVGAPKAAAAAQEVVLPGDIQPLISSPVYSRTDGYLKK